jgi:hypothetical protein
MPDFVFADSVETVSGTDRILTITDGLEKRELYALVLLGAMLTNPLYLREVQNDGQRICQVACKMACHLETALACP